jgi:hypothetical protein
MKLRTRSGKLMKSNLIWAVSQATETAGVENYVLKYVNQYNKLRKKYVNWLKKILILNWNNYFQLLGNKKNIELLVAVLLFLCFW